MSKRYEVLRVVAAAVELHGVVHHVPPPGRHHHVLWKMVEDGLGSQDEHWIQGFLLSDGTFADRKRAAAVALAAGQIEKLNWSPNLFSEDLW